MKSFFLTLATLMLAAMNYQVLAQSKNQLIRKGDDAYEIHAFNTAINNYEEAIKKGAANDVNAVCQLADCYRQLNRLEEAIRNYEKGVRLKKVPAKFLLQYGHALKGLGRYDEAKAIYLEYAKTNAAEGNHFAESCDFAKNELNSPAIYTASNELINTTASEFGPAYYAGKVVFASTRMDVKPGNTDWDGNVFNRLYYAAVGRSGNLDSPYFLKEDPRGANNEGPLAFSPDKRMVAFTRNNFVEGARQIPSAGIQLNLFIADLNNDGNWVNIRAFPFNGGKDYSTGFPAFSADGMTLYFASDRPGGFGGFDLYRCQLSGSSWSAPENLGPLVNTPGNEITPFIDSNRNFYFSSDWHFGFGGFDVFRIEQTGDRWGQLYHLGKGVNSAGDDYNFIIDPLSSTGYLVSNRQGGKGLEDIYRVNRSGKSITFFVTNAADGSPLPGAVVDFTGCGAGLYQTDLRGQYAFQTSQNMSCEIIFRKEGFQDFRLQMAEIQNQTGSEIQIRLSSSRDLFFGSVVDNATGAPLAGVLIQSSNQSTGSTSQVISDAAGYYSLAISPGSIYSIKYSRSGYLNENRTIRTGTLVENNALGIFRMRTVAASTPTNDNQARIEVPSPDTKPGFSVQVAAVSSPDAAAFQNLNSIGNWYIKPEGGKFKVRIGVFETRMEAEKIRDRARSLGYPESFIVQEQGGKQSTAPNQTSGVFMIQIAALKDPRNFDDAKARQFGTITERVKGVFTIKLISGFNTLESTRKALPNVISAGYKDAFIVTEVNGQLVKTK
jgi:tetratricopeptide (TPR) repeat protein/cell division septation protein DedD